MAKKQKQIDYASLYTLRSDGRYVATYRDESGRKRYVYDKNPETLHHKLLAIMEPKEPAPILFKDILKLWEDEACENMDDGTYAGYGASIKRAREQFGDWEALKMMPSDIQNHLDYLALQGKSKSTISKQRVIYRSIFHRAIIDPEVGKIIRINPTLELKIPKKAKPPVERDAPEDDIIQKIQDNATTAYFGIYPMFLICTGLRRGEALALQWMDIDFDTGWINVYKSASLRGSRGLIKDPKTESGKRKAPILAPLRAVLVRPPGAKDTDYIFHGEDPSRPMPKSAYCRKWDHYCREMGFVTDEPEVRVSKAGRKYTVHNYKNTLTAHILRHGFATMLYEAEIDEKEASKLMGHADETMIREVYAHLRKKKQAKSVEKLRAYTQHGLVQPEVVKVVKT